MRYNRQIMSSDVRLSHLCLWSRHHGCLELQILSVGWLFMLLIRLFFRHGR
jgi:hypothetical protein